MSNDPLAIGAVLSELMQARGWGRRLLVARVHQRWDAAVGGVVAAHCRPGWLHDDGVLDVLTDSAAWATQLTYLQGTLLDQLARSCGPGVVKGVRVRTEPEGRRRHRR
jgi:predicted nucleic acid-binding Zn ribbon protein